MANFEFPSNVSISLSAQDLINRLLHPNPELRPKISDIRGHLYFSSALKLTKSPQVTPVKRELVSCVLEPVSGNEGKFSGVGTNESGLIFSIQQSIRTILSNYSSVTSNMNSKFNFKFNIML